MKYIKLSLLPALLLVGTHLAGCSSLTPTIKKNACTGKSFNQLLEATDLKPLFSGIARELCTESCAVSSVAPGIGVVCASAADNPNQSVLVTDFVDIQSFTPASQGILMGELMRGNLSSVCGTKIVQAEFAKFFSLNEKGLVVLSRKTSEIKKDEFDQTEAIVGTYSYLSNKIVIFARRINVVTGKISRMSMREIDYSCNGSTVGYSVK